MYKETPPPPPPPMDASHDPAPPFSSLSSAAALSPHFPPAAANAVGALDLSFTSTASASTSSFTTATTFSAQSLLPLSSTSLFPRSHSFAASLHWAHLTATHTTPPDGMLLLAHLHLIRELAHGHLARVFLCRLKSSPPASPLYALKVIDLRDDDPSVCCSHSTRRELLPRLG
ncbi:unnamed protein product [Urochloa humidicola]